MQKDYLVVPEEGVNFRPTINITGPRDRLAELELNDIRAFVDVLAGDSDGARQILRTLADQGPHRQIPALAVACVHAGLRDFDEAFALLDRAREERDLWLSYMLMANPLFDDLRSDPRYAILVRGIGLTPGS